MNGLSSFSVPKAKNIDDIINEGSVTGVQKEKSDQQKTKDDLSVLEEWTPDIEELKKELRNEGDK